MDEEMVIGTIAKETNSDPSREIRRYRMKPKWKDYDDAKEKRKKCVTFLTGSDASAAQIEFAAVGKQMTYAYAVEITKPMVDRESL